MYLQESAQREVCRATVPVTEEVPCHQMFSHLCTIEESNNQDIFSIEWYPQQCLLPVKSKDLMPEVNHCSIT